MRFCTKQVPALFAAFVVTTALCTEARADDGPAGVVRISDQTNSSVATRGAIYRAQSPDAVLSDYGCEISASGQTAWERRANEGFRHNDLHVGNGTYDIVYANNPSYFDRRDGRVYSAYGYGVPIAVPLAPNVEHAYNFGWGVPSSRLTPISRPGAPYGP